MQAVDVEVQGAGVLVGVERRQGGLSDARRPVEMDESCQRATVGRLHLNPLALFGALEPRFLMYERHSRRYLTDESAVRPSLWV
jgi:hypothetical protein